MSGQTIVTMSSTMEGLQTLKRKIRERDPGLLAAFKEFKVKEFDGIIFDDEMNIIEDRADESMGG
jgi:hypothetical protein